ncbi:flagellar hook-associated protein FlgL [Caminibacter mediatlanticus TB-2]|uniref:Flagellar hook-associated protein FlgL n=1 Tax=Caminibacter mediatlanticus TB-2 TaxID=391592 RepID=A0ABX5V8P1_9BACT|nr:flagellar hook-associated protein FlgL [Caminibacter mediatlanticus]QCT94339.1 flagellar hook-associated protein FlgL [Caminibacter mediatlanticus TB-2]
MRVTQFTLYNNFLLNNQTTLSELNKTQTELSTGKKIQNLYDNPTIYNNYLKLDTEINTFTQIKSSANFALNFARESDTTLNDIVSTLTNFKTKLINAANDTNDITSREAIVSELKGELNHLKDLANSSINGKYIFSGSAFNIKPIDDDFNYQGNDKYVKAFLGSGIEREYNIPGSELFLGRDNDYKKTMTVNIPQYNKMKANPEFVVMGADGKLYIDKNNPNTYSQDVAVNEPINVNSKIRELTGVEDIDNGNGTYTSGTSYFYIKGRRPDGTTINTKFSLSNDDSVSDLLNKIGEIYGNTVTNKVVDVSLNDMGEIQITDLNSGKMISDFFMVASNKDEASVEDLVKNGDYIVEFQKSYYPSAPSLDTITSNNSNFDNRVFKFGAYYYNYKENREAIAQDKVFDVLGDKGIDSNGNVRDVLGIIIRGTDTNGGVKTIPIKLDSTTTFEDIMRSIKNNFGNVDVSFENGELVVTDKSINKTEPSKLSITMTAYWDSDNDNVLATHDTPIKYFTPKDSINFDKLWMSRKDNTILGNYSNIEKDYKIIFKDGEKIIENNPNAQQYITNNSVIMDVMGSDTSPQTLDIKFRDINGELKTASITLDDNGSFFTINGNSYHIYNTNGDISPAHDIITTTTEFDPTTCEICTKENLNKGMTFKQLGDVISMLVTNNLPLTDDASSYNEAVKNAKKEVETGIDDKGRFYLKDLSNSQTKIDLSISNKDSNIYFQANNSLTIDSPQVDFFETLQKAISSVENGENFANANSNNPRDIGIQGAIKAIDHVLDRVRRSHAKIGAVSNEFDMTIQRVDMLKVNVETLQSENIDTDIGEASMKLNSLQLSYQALLASIAKINNLTLLNYLR